MMEEGDIKFLEIKGNTLKFSDCELSGVVQHRFSLKSSMAKYWMGNWNDFDPNVFESAMFACGTENCIIHIWSHDKHKTDDSFDFFGTDEGMNTFSKDDIMKLKKTKLLGHLRPINCVIWNQNCPGYLLSASDDGTICGWGAESMKLTKGSDDSKIECGTIVHSARS